MSEIYIKFAVAYPDDPKVRALARFGSPDAGLARDLYFQMCLYCKRNLTDGWVPAEQIGLLVYPTPADHGEQLAKQLASVGLTKEVSKDGAPGWEVLAFLRRNASREQVEALSLVRATAGAAGGRKSRKRPAQKPGQANRKQVANQVAEQPGSNPVSVSVKTTETDTQAPAVPATLTPTQRSKPITDAYHAAQPMCKWEAINGIVVLAIKSGKYTDDEIRDGLLRLAASGRGVTVETLRVAIEGLPPRPNSAPVSHRQAASDAAIDRARVRARAADAAIQQEMAS